MTTSLAEKICTPCRGGIPPLTRDEAESLRTQAPDWQLVDDARRIERTFRSRTFREALSFVQQVGELAETEGHHPDISFGWGYATVSLRTKKSKGCTRTISSWRRRSTGWLAALADRHTRLDDGGLVTSLRPIILSWISVALGTCAFPKPRHTNLSASPPEKMPWR